MEHSDAGFPATRWSLIDALVNGPQPERDSAMKMLAQTYWPAIYAYLRHSGKTKVDAVELTQGFFTDVIIQRRLFERADATAGSLRSFVLVALKRYAIDCHRREVTRGSLLAVSLDDAEDEDAIYQRNGDSPDESFMRRWALAVLEEALRRCEEHYRASGKESHWLAFESRVIKPSLMMQPAPSHETVAATLKLESAASSVMAVRVVRKRMLALIRQVIAESTSNVSEQEAEYRDILAFVN
jgi:DNA-directed RNA polymerase specialized sigma24 family protein